MKEQVGEAAGKVWQALSEHGELEFLQLVKLVQESDKLVHQSLGWLAREDKIEMRIKGNRTLISLTKS